MLDQKSLEFLISNIKFNNKKLIYKRAKNIKKCMYLNQIKQVVLLKSIRHDQNSIILKNLVTWLNAINKFFTTISSHLVMEVLKF